MNAKNYSSNFKPIFSLNLPMFVFLGLVILVQSCSKDPEPPAPGNTGTGLAAGECRFKTQSDTAVFSYDNFNRITKLGNYEYTYLSNKVVLKDTKVDKSIMTFNLRPNSYPANLEVMGLTDTIAQELTWFVYNPDSSLALSRTFVWVKDKYVYDSKVVYTWTNKNLTRVMGYGKDSVTAWVVINMAYDTSKIDKREPIFKKFLAYEPTISIGYMPMSASRHLLKDLQLILTGEPAMYYQFYHTFDAKGKVLREAMRSQSGTEILGVNYTYECNE
ncbi:MAG: hypothetical protein MH472_04060 [Bacteroidia bacterium]|nr:hypothetical protein [Bacteroidia bacterium]